MGSFQDLLNRFNSKGVAGPANLVPSQMPGAMGGGFDHGIAGNLSDIQQLPYRYGDPVGIQQLPYRYGDREIQLLAQGQGGFNIMNPFTYGNMKKAVEGTRAGDENIEYSDTPTGKIGEAANKRNRLIQELLGESMIVPNTKSENSFGGNFESLLIPRRN